MSDYTQYAQANPGTDYPIKDAALRAKLKLESNLASRQCNGRITLTSGTPVTTGDVLAAVTIYFSPYQGNAIGLFDGADWNMRVLPEINLAVPAVANQVYDLFCYDNAGAPTLEAVAWASDTARATALALQDGVLVKSGAPTRRYLGSFRTTAVAGQTQDSLAKRWIWNYYNRVLRPMAVIESTAAWTYTTNAWRQANGNAANQLDFVIGWAEDHVDAAVSGNGFNTNVGVNLNVGIGVDSSTVDGSTSLGLTPTNVANVEVMPTARIQASNLIGRHTLRWLEKSYNIGTTTFEGANVGYTNAGITGSLLG